MHPSTLGLVVEQMTFTMFECSNCNRKMKRFKIYQDKMICIDCVFNLGVQYEVDGRKENK